MRGHPSQPTTASHAPGGAGWVVCLRRPRTACAGYVVGDHPSLIADERADGMTVPRWCISPLGHRRRRGPPGGEGGKPLRGDPILPTANPLLSNPPVNRHMWVSSHPSAIPLSRMHHVCSAPCAPRPFTILATVFSPQHDAPGHDDRGHRGFGMSWGESTVEDPPLRSDIRSLITAPGRVLATRRSRWCKLAMAARRPCQTCQAGQGRRRCCW